jgi:hypothetical protein
VHRPDPKKKKHSVSKPVRYHDAIKELRRRLEVTKNALERERSVAAAAQEEIKTLKDELEVAKSTSKKALRYTRRRLTSKHHWSRGLRRRPSPSMHMTEVARSSLST